MSCLIVAAALWSSAAVSPTWTSFKAARAADDLTQAPIIDFSYAGYEHGERGIPAASGVRYDVTAYGAVPDDDIDDRTAVDAAIRAAEAAGGGIVFFPPGRFHLSEVEGRTWGCINITGANVVLKGSGSGGPSATELFFRYTTVPEAKGETGPADYFNYGQKTTPLIKFYREEWKASVPSESTITDDAAQGSLRIKVASTAGTDAQGKPFYSAGTQIRLTQQRTIGGSVVRGNTAANDYWLQGLTARPESETILQDGVPVLERHRIKRIVDATTIELAEPLMCSVTAAHGWAISTDGLTPGWGVEDLNLVGAWHPENPLQVQLREEEPAGDNADEFFHHHNWVSDNGWKMLFFEYGLQPYVRRVRVSNVASVPVEIYSCFGGTVINTAVDGVRGHSSFKAKTNAFGTLFAFTYDHDQWHGHAVAVGSVATVITHSKVSDRGVDWHGNFPYATLLDASKGGLFGWGGAEKSLPNHMHDLTFWNFNQSDKETQWLNWDWWEHSGGCGVAALQEQWEASCDPTKKFTYTNPNPGYTAKVVKPKMIGVHGPALSTFNPTSCGIYESQGTPVEPRSLYLAQLELRLGYIPSWWTEAEAAYSKFEELGYFEPAVEIALVLGGSVETFDQANFTMALAASLGVEAADISLDVSAASILVVATILVANASAATYLASALTTATSNTSAFGALLGVTVESVPSPPLVKTMILAAPGLPPFPPPSPPPPPAGPPPGELLAELLTQAEDLLDNPGVRLAMAAALAIFLALVAWRVCRKRGGKDGTVQKGKEQAAKTEEVTVLVEPANEAKPIDLAKVEKAMEKEAGRLSARALSNGALSNGGYHSIATAEAATAESEAATAEAEAAAGATEQLWYYGDVETNQPTGPLSVDAIKTMVTEGKLNSGTQVWNGSLPNWIPLAQAPELQTDKKPISPILKTDLKAAGAAVAAAAALKSSSRRRSEGDSKRRSHKERAEGEPEQEGDQTPIRRTKSAPRTSKSPAIDAQHHWLQQQLREGDPYDEAPAAAEAPRRSVSAPRDTRTGKARSPSSKDAHRTEGKPSEHLTEVRVDRTTDEHAAGEKTKPPGEPSKREPTRRKKTDAALAAVTAVAALKCGASEDLGKERTSRRKERSADRRRESAQSRDKTPEAHACVSEEKSSRRKAREAQATPGAATTAQAGTPDEAQPEASRRRKKKTDAALTAATALNALKGGASAGATGAPEAPRTGHVGT